MYLISHRGNLEGPNPSRENTKQYIEEAVSKGFDVEVDVQGIEGNLYLGHDEPQEQIQPVYLSKLCLWVHAKNIEAVEIIRSWNRKKVISQIHYFWHENDHMTLTSLGIPWVFPGRKIPSGGIAVMPENSIKWETDKAGGVCSDYILNYIARE